MNNQNNSSAPSEYCNQCSIERAAWILESYYAYLQRLSPINFDEHPYIPEIEGVAQDLRAMIAAAHPQQEGKAVEGGQRMEACFACDGTGYRVKHSGVMTYTCGQCNGSGKIPALAQQDSAQAVCSKCGVDRFHVASRLTAA